MKLETWKLADIKPYENNPRKNDDAVDAVAESIRQCGYRAKIIIDENGVILCGHTRLKALQKLGWTEAVVQVENDLTEEQKRKYRLLDNKTAEIADWDFSRLENELEGLDFEGFDFGLDFDVEPTQAEIKEGVKEYDAEEFADEQFKCTCPKCGFKFNP